MTELECVNPEEIEPGDLVAYMHGEASQRVAEHVARCASCADSVEQLRMVDAELLAACYREKCPAPEVLADFALNRLAAVEKLRVAAHVRGCAICTEELETVRDLADEEPPSLLAQLRETLALALTARPVGSAPTLRGEIWQGRFEIDDWSITLKAQAGVLTGQVRRRGTSEANCAGQASLLGENAITDEDVQRSEVDDSGFFEFREQETGSYALLLEIGEQDLTLEGIQMS